MNLIRELLPNPLKNNHQCLATEFGWKLILFSFICSSGFPQPAYFDSLTTNAKSTPQLLSIHSIDIQYRLKYIGASSVKSVSSISSIGPFHAFTPVLAHVTCASPRHETLIKYTERKFNLKSILEDVKKHAKKTQASKQKDNRYVYQLFGAPSGLFQSGFYKRFRGKDLGPCTKRSGQQEFVRSLNRW